ncbi:tripartite tricarboxylate transporter TctB family protein [Spirillospora sp. NPDC029432]|uniref:tripartite tricarboxylate transporter TctB family protein n=1 Tax=Spirillospora sp. NPDC029432 TaxID=3154599 RepID=UPI0034523E17
MSEPVPPAGGRRRAWRGRSELLLAAFVTGLGVFVLAGTASVETAGPGLGPGPRFFPSLVGGALIVTGACYVVDVLRGGRGDPEHTEDTEPAEPAEPTADTADTADTVSGGGAAGGRSDWRAVALVSGAFLGFAALVRPLGWVIAGALLFAGVALALGARPWPRVAAVAVVLGLGTYLLFSRGLGVPLPAGPLEGVLG